MTENRLKVLFVCSANVDRSPTAEVVHRGRQSVAARSAGVGEGAATPVSKQLADWADIVCAMEDWHVRRLREKFASSLERTPVFNLDVPDVHSYMDGALITLIEKKMEPVLRLAAVLPLLSGDLETLRERLGGLPPAPAGPGDSAGPGAAGDDGSAGDDAAAPPRSAAGGRRWSRLRERVLTLLGPGQTGGARPLWDMPAPVGTLVRDLAGGRPLNPANLAQKIVALGLGENLAGPDLDDLLESAELPPLGRPAPSFKGGAVLLAALDLARGRRPGLELDLLRRVVKNIGAMTDALEKDGRPDEAARRRLELALAGTRARLDAARRTVAALSPRAREKEAELERAYRGSVARHVSDLVALLAALGVPEAEAPGWRQYL
ncbi:MAG: hypothetical protein LBP95_08960 [Deltaproteobacteria bacterium]|jgi:predicted protein tyrosine phosphatase|nr:hypothetical protein [Deltaproteobacteria bacterium]